MTDNSHRAEFARRYTRDLIEVLGTLPWSALAKALDTLERAYAERRQIFLAGNGGSAATASHMANDLMKGVAKGGGREVRAIALSDNVALLTAIANDEGYEEVFAGQLVALAEPGDVLVVISGSGNSPNLVRAVEVARKGGLTTIGLLGKGGGKLGAMVDVPVVVPSDDYGLIESTHLAFDHLIATYLRNPGTAAVPRNT